MVRLCTLELLHVVLVFEFCARGIFKQFFILIKCFRYSVQFYASKKKSKGASPLLKSKLVEKDARVTLDASPSGKGSLEGFLVTSQDDLPPAGSLQTANCSSARTDFVKRKLELDVRLSSKDENEEVYLGGEGPCQMAKASGEAQQKKLKTSDVGDFSSKGLGKDTSDSSYGLKNPELKQFAADFLSLYCRYCI